MKLKESNDEILAAILETISKQIKTKQDALVDFICGQAIHDGQHEVAYYVRNLYNNMTVKTKGDT